MVAGYLGSVVLEQADGTVCVAEQDVDVPIVVVIGHRRAHRLGVPSKTELIGNINEHAIADVLVERVVLHPDVRVDAPGTVPQVPVAVEIVVQPVAVPVDDGNLLVRTLQQRVIHLHVGAVALVLPEVVRTEVGLAQVEVAIVVVIGGVSSHSRAGVAQPSVVGNHRERAVLVVPVQRRDAEITGDEQVLPSIVIVIEPDTSPRDAAAGTGCSQLPLDDHLCRGIGRGGPVNRDHRTEFRRVVRVRL